jgi:alpha-L-fucosidase
LFIDGEPKEPCKEEAWKLQPDLIITRGAINTPEQHIPGTSLDMLWESCITMGTEWTYKPTNDILKSGGRLIELLVETRSKGGNLLLNIGPHPEGYVPVEQESRLLEISAWNFINHEAIENVRPWIIPKEDNIWFTSSKDKKTLYAVIMSQSGWIHGERKDFILHSVQATPGTKISVLGQNDLVVEYKNSVDAKSYFTQKEDGLHISVVRAQRIYSNYEWPNPVTVKLENIEAALDPPIVETINSVVSEKGVTISGKGTNLKDSESLKGAFEYHLYGGFSGNINNTEWNKTGSLSMDNKGEFRILLNNLERGKEYEYRAIIMHPKITIRGEIKRFTY